MVFSDGRRFIGEQGLGVMYVFLLFLGAVTTAAGVALVTSVVTGHDGAFDAETITPGTIAAVGGLLLVGLGLTVRALQRIEWALAARPMLRPSRPGETPAAAAERASAPARIPFPPRPKTESGAQAAALAANAAPASAEDAALERLQEERLQEKFPTMMRLENASVVAEADISLLPQEPAGTREDAGVKVNGTAVGRTNGAAPPKLMPLGADARPSGSPARPKGSVFDAFWPKGPRARKDAGPAPAQMAAPSALQAESAQADEVAAPGPRHPVNERAAPAQTPVSILKSGVVDGMAYTLYSDGSIEAQFPQGTLRFGSINELRNHIESNA